MNADKKKASVLKSDPCSSASIRGSSFILFYRCTSKAFTSLKISDEVAIHGQDQWAWGAHLRRAQRARRVRQRRKLPNQRVTDTARLARLNLAVHGLSGDIKQGNLECWTLCDLFPPDCDPPWTGGDVTPDMEARRMRGQIPGMIASRATEAACGELLRLANLRPASEWIHWTYREAVTNVRRKLWQPPSVAGVKKMLQQPTARWIDNEDDLLDLVLESLERFQKSLTGQSLPAVETLWRWDGAGQSRSNFQPKDEEALSDDVARWLRADLGTNAGVVVNREVQPRRGNRTDVIVEAVRSGVSPDSDKCVIVIEVKGCWHPEVKTAIESQLVDDYLRPNGWRCGIYLVGWFVCDRWKIPKNRLAGKNLADAKMELKGYAKATMQNAQYVRVESFLLDCSL